MAIIFKKKSSPIFSPPSYIKGSSIESKVDEIIKQTIQDKIFNVLGINKKVYIRLVEYFNTYTISSESGNKTVSSFRMRIKNNIYKEFHEVSSREIEISGINITEFDNYLLEYGAKKIEDVHKILEVI